MLELEAVRDYCLQKPGTSEDFPFDEETLVFRVMNKIFLLTNVERQCPAQVNLKCEPTRALELREQFQAIEPGYHMNKKHWNTLTLNDTLTDELIFELIDHSYALVVKGLKKSDRVLLTEQQTTA